ncbi:MAG: enoyl-CoA hydratase-related protein, partial [Ilumatobacteraceae bacterium]
MGELVRIGIVDGVATITLDSQHNRNALSRQLVAELSACLDDAEGADVRAIVLRHAGPAFCAGADLKERAAETTQSGSTPASGPMVSVMRRLMTTPRPTLAAVHGAVRAGGIGLMASCDLVVVDTAVTFALTEVRIGVAPAIICVPILRRVPSGKIAAAMLTGEIFTADEAREMGLVTHVTDDVESTVAALIQGILAGAPRAVAEAKR